MLNSDLSKEASISPLLITEYIMEERASMYRMKGIEHPTMKHDVPIIFRIGLGERQGLSSTI